MSIVLNVPSPSDNTIELDTYAKKKQISNVNLLDNPWFSVNQRQGKIVLPGAQGYFDKECTNPGDILSVPIKIVELTSTYGRYVASDNNSYYVKAEDVIDGYYNPWRYTVDRWISFEHAIVIPTDDGVTIKKSSADTYDAIAQYLDPELVKKLIGKSVVFSFEISNVNCSIPPFAFFRCFDKDENWVLDNPFSIFDGINISNKIIIPNNCVNISLGISHYYTGNINDTLTVKCIKLEVGEMSTLHMDTAPNYATELLKCQRYFIHCTKLSLNRHMTDYFNAIGVNNMRNSSSTVDMNKTFVADYLGGPPFNIKILEQCGYKDGMKWFKIVKEDGSSIPSDYKSIIINDIEFTADL